MEGKKKVYRIHKRAGAIGLICLLLVSLSAQAGSAAGWLSQVRAWAFGKNVIRPMVAQVAKLLHENRAFPKVIDRWTDPEAFPDFAFSPEADLLEIWFPRIRDRDAAIFLYQGECWMLDCSDEQAEERVVPLLKALGIQKIDRMINTHPHHDHLNGLYAVDAAVPVRELMICFPEDSTADMVKAVAYAKEKGIRVTNYGDEQVFCMGDEVVRFLAWMKTDEAENMNDRSAQFMVSYGECDMIFMADIEFHGQDQLLAALGSAPLKADILRYPHHGKRAMRDEVFQAINPAMVVITSSEGAPEVRESTRFFEYYYKDIPRVYTTRGYLHLTTDGHHWLCEKVEDETLFGDLDEVDAPAMRWK